MDGPRVPEAPIRAMLVMGPGVGVDIVRLGGRGVDRDGCGGGKMMVASW
jgi:hypothetical protein